MEIVGVWAIHAQAQKMVAHRPMGKARSIGSIGRDTFGCQERACSRAQLIQSVFRQGQVIFAQLYVELPRQSCRAVCLKLLDESGGCILDPLSITAPKDQDVIALLAWRRNELNDPSASAGIPAVDKGVPTKVEGFDKRVVCQTSQGNGMWGWQIFQRLVASQDGKLYVITCAHGLCDSAGFDVERTVWRRYQCGVFSAGAQEVEDRVTIAHGWSHFLRKVRLFSMRISWPPSCRSISMRSCSPRFL